MSCVPQPRIDVGRIKPWFDPALAISSSERVRFTRAQIIQQMRDMRGGLAHDPGCGNLSSGVPHLTVTVMGSHSVFGPNGAGWGTLPAGGSALNDDLESATATSAYPGTVAGTIAS